MYTGIFSRVSFIMQRTCGHSKKNLNIKFESFGGYGRYYKVFEYPRKYVCNLCVHEGLCEPCLTDHSSQARKTHEHDSVTNVLSR